MNRLRTGFVVDVSLGELVSIALAKNILVSLRMPRWPLLVLAGAVSGFLCGALWSMIGNACTVNLARMTADAGQLAAEVTALTRQVWSLFFFYRCRASCAYTHMNTAWARNQGK